MLSTLHELWLFLRSQKKYWLLPLIVASFMIGLLLVLANGSAVAPFIYTLF
jgi:NAD/NADP transhydrogenase beta subunit